MSRRIKLWTGVGAFVLAGTGAGEVPEFAADKAEAKPLATSASGVLAANPARPLILTQGGEQGEAGEAGEQGERPAASEGGEAGEAGEQGEAGEAGERARAGAEESPAVFGAHLLMMQGHLMAGQTLAQEGRAEMAAPHLRHPLEEHYEALESAFGAHGVEDFEDELKAVSALAEQPDSDQLAGAVEGAQKKIMEAFEKLPPEQRLAAIGPLVHVLAEEYEEGVKDGKVVNLEEYQDAWGFLQAAQSVVASIPADAVDAADLEQVKASLGELAEALPSPVPPEAGLADAGAVKAAASEIELVTSNL